MPQISLTSRHATRPNSKKFEPPSPPHNTTHKNIRHIGLHYNTRTVPQHHNLSHTTTFVPDTTYITPQQHRTSHNTTTHHKVATFIIIIYVLRFKETGTLEQIFEDKTLYLMQNPLIQFMHAFL